MKTSYSFSAEGSKGTEQNADNKGRKGTEQNADNLNKKPICPKKLGSHSECVKDCTPISSQKDLPKNVFIWKIDGFKSLLDHGKGSTSTAFQMQGITWCLRVNPMDRKIWYKSLVKHMSLDLEIAHFSASPNYMIQTTFRFFIHDQQRGKHIEHEVSHTYTTTSRKSGVQCMIPLKTLKNPSLGFLFNDTIAVGVELIQFKKVPCNGLERSSIINKNRSTGSYSWYIESFFQLSKPVALSEPFQIARYTWRLHLEPKSVYNKNYVGLYLTLHDKSGSQLPPPSGVMVQFVLSIKRQSQGAYQLKGRSIFNHSNLSWGYAQFIRLEDFIDPSNGYLIKGTCTMEVSICIFGSANDRTS